MADDIGNLYPTKIPLLTDNADIQEAFRLYHYGAGIADYNPLNENKTNLLPNSIAYHLNYLQNQITTVSGTLGVQQSAWTAKGTLLTATAAGVTYALPVGASNGMVLTVKSTAANGTGIEWVAPEVLPDNVVTLSNKTLTAPKFGSAGYIADNLGLPLISFPTTVSSAVNAITISNASTGNKPTISATGSDTNITLNLVSKGTGTVQVNGNDIVTTSATQTLSNKTLSAPTLTQAYITDTITFEGLTADAFETTLGVIDPTTDNIINLPNVSGTIITSGNISDIPTIPTNKGGTNLTSFTANGAVYATSTSALTTGTLPAISGGTGQALYTIGDILYADTTTTLAKRSPTVNGYILTLVAGVPSWAAAPISLPTQTGNAGKYLTTDGTNASWATIPGGYTAPTLGSTVLTSGATILTVAGLTLTAPTINGGVHVLGTTSSSTDASISWDTTNKKIKVGAGTYNGQATQSIDFAPSTLNISTPTFTTNIYTAVLSDKDKWLELSNGSNAGTFTVPTDASQAFPYGSQINLIQTGAGQITIAGASGVTVNGTPGLKFRAQWSSVTLIKRGLNLWVAIGDLTA